MKISFLRFFSENFLVSFQIDRLHISFVGINSEINRLGFHFVISFQNLEYTNYTEIRLNYVASANHHNHYTYCDIISSSRIEPIVEPIYCIESSMIIQIWNFLID